MVQDSRDLPQNAGATTGGTHSTTSGSHSTTGTTSNVGGRSATSTGTTGTTGSTHGATTGRPDSPTFIGSGQTGTTGGTGGLVSNAPHNSTPTSRSTGTEGMTSSTYENRSHQDHREIVAMGEDTRPSTATIIGGALAGAIIGGALPFMLGGRSSRQSQTTTIEESIVIDRPARELYTFWRDFTNFPQFMDNIKSVQKFDERRSHWVIKAPAGTSVEFDSLITDDIPNRLISWKSAEGATVRNSGRVEFIETPTGATNVRTTLSYDPPAGSLGRAAAKLFGREPKVQAREDLQRFKELMENRR